jgi:thioredoxin-related protein
MIRAFLMVSPAARTSGRTNRPAPLFAALAIFLLVLAAPVPASESRDPDEYFFTQTFGDLPEEMAVAREEGKSGMLLFFMADACPYCRHMLEKVFTDPAVQDWYRERFVNIAVDIHGDVELTDFDGITLPSKVFSDHRKVFLTPVVSFIDLDGNEIYRHLGMIRTPEEMLLLGEYIEGRHYFDTEYRTFAQQQGMQGKDVLATPGEETE